MKRFYFLLIVGLIVFGGCKKPIANVYISFEKGENPEYQGDLPTALRLKSGTALKASQIKPLDKTKSYTFDSWYDGDNRVEEGYVITKDSKLKATWLYNNGLSFTASAKQTLKLNSYGGMEVSDTLKYSFDGQSWKNIDVNEPLEFGGATKIYIIGDTSKESIQGTAENFTKYLYFSFESEALVKCQGDLRSLSHYQNPSIASTSSARFCYLFHECTQLIIPPDLKAEHLASQCYRGLFANCTQLQKAPQLPAKTLTEECYYNMFADCKELIEAPQLEAKDLAKKCYFGMFVNCTQLQKAPMLEANKVASSCYQNMFTGCTQLESVVMLATEGLNPYVLSNWLNEVATEGVVYVANNDMKENSYIKGSLPSGSQWKIEVYKP